MNRLQNIFTNAAHPLFVADVCGAPDMVQSEKRIQTLIDNSVDIVNLIVPFSDPMADGAAVQTAAQQALANGADLEKVLQMIASIRKNNPESGLIISGYYNVFLQYGLEKLFARLAELEIDGILINDLPHEERGEIADLCNKSQVARIVDCGIVKDTARLQVITAEAEGFIICSAPEAVEFLSKTVSVPLAVDAALPVRGNAVLLPTQAVTAKTEDLAELIRQYRK